MGKKEKNKFAQVKCEKCKNEQVIFTRATSFVHCLVCNEILAEPTGGKALLKTKVLEYLG